MKPKVCVRVNECGRRIGESHPRAKLTDAEVEQLIYDRGPEHAPTMSLARLARKWGMSKSGVKAIIDGRNRGQAGIKVGKEKTRRPVSGKKVRVFLRLPLHHRAKLRRLGGSMWVEKAVSRAHEPTRKLRNENDSQEDEHGG